MTALAAMRKLLTRASLPELEVRPDVPLFGARGLHFLTPMQEELIATLVNGAPELLDAAEDRDRLRAELASMRGGLSTTLDQLDARNAERLDCARDEVELARERDQAHAERDRLRKVIAEVADEMLPHDIGWDKLRAAIGITEDSDA